MSTNTMVEAVGGAVKICLIVRESWLKSSRNKHLVPAITSTFGTVGLSK